MAAASLLVKAGVEPNQVSVMSAVFATVGAVLFIVSAGSSHGTAAALFAGGALCIQLRLLCNMLDGLMAVEHGKSSKQGDVFNEFPDRVADAVLFVGAAYATQAGSLGITLGWLCALLAIGTAYIRAFGARYMPAQDFSGPMAKQQRMFFLTVGAIFSSFEVATCGTAHSMFFMLVFICVGTAATCVLRTKHLLKAMGE